MATDYSDLPDREKGIDECQCKFPGVLVSWQCFHADMESEEGNLMSLLTVAILLALLVTVFILVGGVGSMAHGGDFDQRHSHQFMFARIGAQGLTLLLLAIALLLSLR
jgi:hypothetical protein